MLKNYKLGIWSNVFFENIFCSWQICFMFFPTKKKKSPTISKIGYWIFVHPYKISPYNYHLFKSPPGRNLCIWSSLLAYFFLRSSLRLLFVLPRSSGDLRLSSSIFCSSNRWSEKIVCYLVTLVGFTFQFLDRDSNLWSFRLLLLLFLYFLLYVWRKTSGTVRKKKSYLCTGPLILRMSRARWRGTSRCPRCGGEWNWCLVRENEPV